MMNPGISLRLMCLISIIMVLVARCIDENSRWIHKTAGSIQISIILHFVMEML